MWGSGMERIRIGDICEVLNGFAFKSENYVDSGIRVIRIANVQKGFIEDNAPAFYPNNSEGIDRFMLAEGDLLMSLTGNVGRVAFLAKEFLPAALNQRVACLRMKTDRISKRYLFHILNSDFFESQCIQSSKGVAQKNMSTEWLKEYEIPIYSQAKQKEIVSILDNVLLIIEERKRQLRTLDTLIKARFVEMFGDVKQEDALLNLCNIIDYRGKTPEKVEDGLPFITAKNVRMHQLSKEPREYISKETYDSVMTRGFPREGDVVFTTEAPLGNVCRLPHFDTEFYVGQRIVTLQTEKLAPAYLEYALDTDEFRRKVEGKSSGSTVTGIRVRLLEQLTIPVPSRTSQDQFAAFVSQVDKSKLSSDIVQRIADMQYNVS